MALGATLGEYLVDCSERRESGLAIAAAVDAVAAASIRISHLVRSGASAGLSLRAGVNADGDIQKDLDLEADELLRDSLRRAPIAALASEEKEQIEIWDPSAPVCVAIDPLDGSSNIETNISIGTIFSVVPTAPRVEMSFNQKGSAQLAAGFVVYGPQTILVVTTGDGVDVFLLDPADDIYKLVRAKVAISRDHTEYAINASNSRHWDAPIRAFIGLCVTGADGPLGANFNMRWVGSLVAEVYRILVRGGIFLYPGDGREGYGEGRLRLVYEAHPMAFVIEQAGGVATTGRLRILDMAAQHLHQRIPLILGSAEEVRLVERLHTEVEIGISAPLFARRGLFRN